MHLSFSLIDITDLQMITLLYSYRYENASWLFFSVAPAGMMVREPGPRRRAIERTPAVPDTRCLLWCTETCRVLTAVR